MFSYKRKTYFWKLGFFSKPNEKHINVCPSQRQKCGGECELESDNSSTFFLAFGSCTVTVKGLCINSLCSLLYKQKNL